MVINNYCFKIKDLRIVVILNKSLEIIEIIINQNFKNYSHC